MARKSNMAAVRHYGLWDPVIILHILKPGYIIHPHAKNKTRKMYIKRTNLWADLNSKNLVEMVVLSGRRHLGFSVPTKIITRNGFYVPHIYF